MKKWFCSICVLTLISLLVVNPVLAWDVTQIKTKPLPIAGDVTFTSAFTAEDTETIIITIWPADSSVTISDVELVKITPKPKEFDPLEHYIEIVKRNISVDVTLHNSRTRKSTFHLWLYVSTGEHLGVNVHFGR